MGAVASHDVRPAWRLSLVTAATADPVSLADAKRHSKIDVADDDTTFARLIESATAHVEADTDRRLLTQTWDLKLDRFPSCGPIVLPFPPVSSVTSVSYVDSAGATQTWTAGSTGYTTDLPAGPYADHALIYPSYGVSYPGTRDQLNAVTVRFVCGYGSDPADVPSAIRSAVLVLTEHWYSFRGVVSEGINSVTSQIPVGVPALLAPYVCHWPWRER